MSIKGFLVLVICALITLVTFLAAIEGYKQSMQKAEALFDDELKVFAHVLLSIAPQKPISMSEIQSPFMFQLWQSNQLLLSSQENLTTPMSGLEQGYSEQNFLGKRWRVFHQHHADTDMNVYVAQPSNKRFEVAEQLVLTAVTPIIWAIPLVALFIYFVVRHGLKPLNQLSRTLANKSKDDLTAIEQSNDFVELTPVIETLNSLLLRLHNAFEREQQFTADVAHELRTPISALKINLHNLANTAKVDTQTIDDLDLSIQRMSDVVEQLLMFHRTKAQVISAEFCVIDLHHLVQQTIAENYLQFERKKQTISLDGEACSVMANEFLVSVMIKNILNNACKYTPDGGQIKVTTVANSGYVILRVADSGEGIDREQYERVMQRFVRINNKTTHKEIGSGLGLAIVNQIADIHNAGIELSRSDLGGLAVTITFVMAKIKDGHD